MIIIVVTTIAEASQDSFLYKRKEFLTQPKKNFLVIRKFP